MKSFIKKLLKQRLDEVRLTTHAIERAEERVWGTKGKMANGKVNDYPPTINADAWKDEESYNKIDVPVSSGGSKEVPVTSPVREIMQKINFIQNDLYINDDIGLDEKKNETINLLIYYSPNKINYGGNIWGDSLTAVCKPDGSGGFVSTIQWQTKTKDLATLKGGVKEGYPKYIVSVDYLINNGITKIDKTNVDEIALYSKKEKKDSEVSKKETFKKIKLTDGRTVKYYKESNKFETMEGQPIDAFDILELLPKEIQDAVMA